MFSFQKVRNGSGGGGTSSTIPFKPPGSSLQFMSSSNNREHLRCQPPLKAAGTTLNTTINTSLSTQCLGRREGVSMLGGSDGLNQQLPWSSSNVVPTSGHNISPPVAMVAPVVANTNEPSHTSTTK